MTDLTDSDNDLVGVLSLNSSPRLNELATPCPSDTSDTGDVNIFDLNSDTSPLVQNIATPTLSGVDDTGDVQGCDFNGFNGIAQLSATPNMRDSPNLVGDRMLSDSCDIVDAGVFDPITHPTINNSKNGAHDTPDATQILNEIRTKYVKNLLIGNLNINSLANKFDALSLIIKDRLDILVLGETKLDDSFPVNQFRIEGFTKPYRLDRNHFGAGVMIYVRQDIPSKQLKKHNFSKNIEALFVEINLRKSKLLLVGAYHSTHTEHGTNDNTFFEQIGFALDVYCNYDKFILAGDLNVQEDENSIQEFLDEFEAKKNC